MDNDERRQLLDHARAILERAQREGRDLTEDERIHVQGNQDLVRAAGEWRNQRDGSFRYRPDPDDGGGGGMKIGLDKRELRRYSITRAIRAAADQDWRGAELEREASETASKLLHREPQGGARGFLVPYDVLTADVYGEQREQRDLSVGTSTAGGHTVQTDVLGQSFIDLLRNRMRVREAGATVLADLEGNVAIPRQTAGAAGGWAAEGSPLTERNQTFDQVPLAPQIVGAFTDFTRKLLVQSSIDIEAFVRGDIAAGIALEMDRAALHGTGTAPEPRGIANVTGIGLVSIGTDGGAPTWAHIVGLEKEVAIDNADLGRLAYITNAKVRSKLKTVEKATNTGLFVWGEGATPLNGFVAPVTNQVRSDLTKGTGTALSAIFFGNWAELIIGLWGGLDVLVDPYTQGTSGIIRVIASQLCDIAVRHPESFAWINDAVTT